MYRDVVSHSVVGFTMNTASATSGTLVWRITASSAPSMSVPLVLLTTPRTQRPLKVRGLEGEADDHCQLFALSVTVC